MSSIECTSYQKGPGGSDWCSIFSEEKGISLKEFGAQIYVGDHPGDVKGAKVANALCVAVPTGPTSAAELLETGADVVLYGGLAEFRDWFQGWLAAR